ncbi:hypothetical protein JTE90_008009 [Oedothorax gibbosus]|uniref:C2H2-type domain-containing protein n=1 Tax=Oedothorax gibbosus TaxID=931172 RepID=A0AAV6UVR8_9ARAC|nr:hypothetical protein JTE90_008009 [Oedothorax gibbosus]
MVESLAKPLLKIKKWHLCEQCGREFKTKSLLQQHTRMFHAPRLYRCPQCFQTFKYLNQFPNVEEFLQKYNTYLQQINHHPSSSAVLPGMENVCPICLKTYSTKHSMKRHLLMHKPFHHCNSNLTFHTVSANSVSLKPFQCDVCLKEFTTSYSLRRHRTIHNPNFEPYRCPVCNSQFNWKDNLRAHMMCVHGQDFAVTNATKFNA